MTDMRAFLAINVNDKVRDHLEDIKDKIKLTNRGKGTYTSAENYHLSLAFLDEITRDQAEILLKILRVQLAGHSPFTLSLKNLGFFGDENQATVWCSVNPSNDLKSLVSDVYKSVRDARIHFDSKPFKAHITIGRKVNLMNCILNDIHVENLSFDIDGVSLYKSTLTPTGPIYEEIGYIDL